MRAQIIQTVFSFHIVYKCIQIRLQSQSQSHSQVKSKSATAAVMDMECPSISD